MATMTKLCGYRGPPALFSSASGPVLRAQNVRDGDDRRQSLPVDHELFRCRDRLAGRCEGLMAAGFGFPSADLASPDTLVLVHMISIGWLSMAMCGALLQFVPVLVSGPLYAENWALPAFVFLTAGLVTLLAGFLALGGRLPPWLWLLPVGAGLLVAGFGLVAVDLALTVWRVARRAVPRASCSSVSFRSARPPAWARRSPGSSPDDEWPCRDSLY